MVADDINPFLFIINPFLNIRQVLTKTSPIGIGQIKNTPLFSQIEYRCFELGRGRGPQLAYFRMGRPARLVRTPSYLYFYKVDISYSFDLNVFRPARLVFLPSSFPQIPKNNGLQVGRTFLYLERLNCF